MDLDSEDRIMKPQTKARLEPSTWQAQSADTEASSLGCKFRPSVRRSPRLKIVTMCSAKYGGSLMWPWRLLQPCRFYAAPISKMYFTGQEES